LTGASYGNGRIPAGTRVAAEGTKPRLTRVIAGLDSINAGEHRISAAGQEVEEDNPYRERIRSRRRSRIPGDTKETYKYYAESVTGVRSARIIRTPRGAGTTDVIVASVGGIPSVEPIRAAARKRGTYGLRRSHIYMI
jgi:uncharacterized phage protein gp47/JayE